MSVLRNFKDSAGQHFDCIVRVTNGFRLNRRQEQLKTGARDFLSNECPSAVVRKVMAEESGLAPDLYQKIAELGWTGLIVPEEFGGLGSGDDRPGDSAGGMRLRRDARAVSVLRRNRGQRAAAGRLARAMPALAARFGRQDA